MGIAVVAHVVPDVDVGRDTEDVVDDPPQIGHHAHGRHLSRVGGCVDGGVRQKVPHLGRTEPEAKSLFADSLYEKSSTGHDRGCAGGPAEVGPVQVGGPGGVGAQGVDVLGPGVAVDAGAVGPVGQPGMWSSRCGRRNDDGSGIPEVGVRGIAPQDPGSGGSLVGVHGQRWGHAVVGSVSAGFDDDDAEGCGQANDLEVGVENFDRPQ